MRTQQFFVCLIPQTSPLFEGSFLDPADALPEGAAVKLVFMFCCEPSGPGLWLRLRHRSWHRAERIFVSAVKRTEIDMFSIGWPQSHGPVRSGSVSCTLLEQVYLFLHHRTSIDGVLQDLWARSFTVHLYVTHIKHNGCGLQWTVLQVVMTTCTHHINITHWDNTAAACV